MIKTVSLFLLLAASAVAAAPDSETTTPVVERIKQDMAAREKGDGFTGIWYANQASKDEYAYKYSGGFATYPQQHIPIAIYSKEANKTFFCYGGAKPGTRELLHMVSYFDHVTSTVARPTLLVNKKTEDAHDNPVMSIDAEGYLWIFSPAHGTSRPTYLHRSTRPYSIDAFEQVEIGNFSYPQPWHFPGKGFVFLHTQYKKGRSLFVSQSPDGRNWSDARLLSRISEGHYQISWPCGERLGTAFNYHPTPGGLNARTNLYYLESADFGRTWTTAGRGSVNVPLTTTETATVALIRDYQAEGLLVYLKDLNYDAAGHPVILYLTSRGFESGPANDPRAWHTARWTGDKWEIRDFTTSDSNYDFGSLYIEEDGTWRIIAPTAPGPQPYNPGGEVEMWLSSDQGAGWKKVRQLTRDSVHNHSFIRRPKHAHPDFYALWADGHGRKPSDVSLYFTNRAGDTVWRLPRNMTTDHAAPEPVQ